MSSESISDKLRRWAEESESGITNPICSASNEFKIGCSGIHCYDCAREALHRIADLVDEEQRKLREEAIKPAIRGWAHERGMDMLEGEGVSHWLDRWFIERPLFDDGTPVQFGDRYGERGINARRIILRKDGWTVDNGDAGYNCGIESESCKGKLPRYRKPVFDAKGVPIEVGDTVYPAISEGGYLGKALKVLSVGEMVKVAIPARQGVDVLRAGSALAQEARPAGGWQARRGGRDGL